MGAAEDHNAPLRSLAPLPPSNGSWRELVPELMSYKPLLNPLSLDRGMSYEGTMLRMESFVGRLVHGKDVTVAAIGGSTTAGAGSHRGFTFHNRYHKWLKDTFPKANVLMAVNGLGGTRSALFNACSHRMVTEDADMYIVEFAINDPWEEPIDGPTRLGFEQLIRKLLRGRKKPAVVILNQHALSKAQGTFYRTAERDLESIGEYYDIPVLSMRNAVWNVLGKKGFFTNGTLKQELMAMGPPEGRSRWQDRYAPGTPILDIERAYLYWDGVHPSDMTGQRVLSDLLVDVTRRATRRLFSESTTWWHGGHGSPPLLPTPPPMFAGNWEINTSRCYMQEDILDHAIATDGFEWKPRKPKAATRMLQQWGFHANRPGASVRISLDTTFSAIDEKEKSTPAATKKLPPVDLVLAIVKSWGNYGFAEFRCEKGCTCEKTTIDCKWQFNNTQASLVPIPVTQSSNCTFSITILPSLKNNGTMFEMRGALVVNHGTQLFTMPARHGDAVAGNVNERRKLMGFQAVEGRKMKASTAQGGGAFDNRLGDPYIEDPPVWSILEGSKVFA